MQYVLVNNNNINYCVLRYIGLNTKSITMIDYE